MAVIRTPDQRVRVFVSSTLGEMAAERAAVRDAIEGLHLTPVMFELGARPHPPRDLYRAYLDQSHVFVGIYGASYGWVAPDEDISGLEDEYRRAGDRPRLLYIKRLDGAREARLDQLIVDFQSDDRASYKPFATPDELAELVARDLAVLLSERFERVGADAPNQITSAPVPAPPNEMLGRDRELADLVERLRGGARLVTLTGPGGVGKTRLSLAAAGQMGDEHLVGFVDLSDVHDADRALRTIASQLGARIDGTRTVIDAVVDEVRGRPVLLVLDNLEQIPDIGPCVAELLEAAPDLQVLATSRRALRVRAEQEVRVPPLSVGSEDGSTALDDEPAIELFLERAAAVAAPLERTPESIATIRQICRRVEGLPLAIEIAAARTRLLPPGDLLDRLGDRLDVLVSSATDVPERHRTLRATIDWSHELLGDGERRLLRRLSVFAGGWTLDAAEAVCGYDGADVLDQMASLLDSSLVVASRDEGGGARFTMTESVREYATERLRASDERSTVEARHVDHFFALGHQGRDALCGAGQQDWVDRLDPERANFRRAVATALEQARYVDVVEFTWDVVVLYFVSDAVDEPLGWLRAVAEASPDLDEITAAKLTSLYALTRIHHGDYDGAREDLGDSLGVFTREGMDFESAVVRHQLGFARYRLDGDVAAAISELRTSTDLFDALGHHWGVALAQAMLGSVLAAEGDLVEAERCQQRSLERARLIDSGPQIVQALHQLVFIRLLEGREDEAFDLLRESSVLLRGWGLRTDATYCLDALALVAMVHDDVETAADALGVAAAERDRLGIAPWPSIEPSIDRVAADVRHRLGDEDFAARMAQARERELFDCVGTTLAAVGALGAPR